MKSRRSLMSTFKVLRRLSLVIGVLTCGALLPAAWAADIPIVNRGFEQPVLSCNPGQSCSSVGGTPIPGWTVIGNPSFVTVRRVPLNLFASIPEGLQVVLVQSQALSQTLTATLQQSTTYTLGYSLGRATGSGLNGYRVELLAGSTVLASDSSLTPVAAGTFATGRIVFDSASANPALIGTPLQIRFTNISGDAFFDRISLDGTPNGFSKAVSQVASGGGWKTALTLVNLTTVPSSVNVSFFDDGGQPLSLPVVTTPAVPGVPASAASIAATLAPGATLVIESEGPATVPVSVGWAQVNSSTPLSGFAIFRLRANGIDSEGTAPADETNVPVLVLPFDNTAGFATGVALTNPTDVQASIVATILDASGAQIGVQTVDLPPRGHLALFFTERFPVTAGRRGVVQFRNPAGHGVTALGLRFSPSLSFTSVPVVYQ